MRYRRATVSAASCGSCNSNCRCSGLNSMLFLQPIDQPLDRLRVGIGHERLHLVVTGRQAEQVAQAIGGRVIAADPLAADYVDNMRRVARQFAEALQP